MGHGTTLTRHEGLSVYAERFAAAGAAVLAFDYRHFGDSPGQPRQRFRTSLQLEDWRSAIAFTRRQESIDDDRMALWGYSIAGGYAVQLAARDSRVAAVLATFPMLDGLARARATPAREIPWTIRPGWRDILYRHTPITATGPPGAHALFNFPGEAEGFARAVAPRSQWRNEISAGAFVTGAWFRPVTKSARVTCPIWVSIGDRDVSAPAKPIERMAKRAPRAELHRYPFDHFDALVGENLARVADDQVVFLRKSAVIRGLES
jgi:dienelactone hydrolase